MNRAHRAQVANQTLQILEEGQYRLPEGQTVKIASEINDCCESTQLFQPEDLQRLLAQHHRQPPPGGRTEIEVANETTLCGIRRLAAECDGPVAALNFASAKNPGGGFLGGSQAQEESLARASGLYRSLMKAWPFYEHHRGLKSLLYTDAMILSPRCPIFRDDSDALLGGPHVAGFITSAAPNAGAIRDKRPEELQQLPATFRRRAEYVLALAAAQGYKYIVLGAWGCGVFRNDPEMVADIFTQLLASPGWSGRFSKVLFSVLDRSPDLSTFRAFERGVQATWRHPSAL